jgi:ATP-binding cassette subfamily B multidrug efflux pump
MPFAISMKDLAYLNKFIWKYRWHLLPGIVFVIISNLFSVLPAQVIRLAFDLVTDNIGTYRLFQRFRSTECYL